MAEELQNAVETAENTGAEQPTEQKIDYEAEVTKLMAEVKKLKATADKNASEASEYKKKWKASLDETQQANLAKEEADKAMREELEMLRKESTVSKYAKNYLAMGYSEELANQASIAQFDGDTDALFSIQKKVMEQLQKDIKAELTKSMPTPPISNDGGTSMTQEQFDKLTLAEQVDLKNKNPELFKKFAY